MKKPPVKAKGGKAPAGKKRGLGHIRKIGLVSVHSGKPPAAGTKTGKHVTRHPHHKAAPKKAPAKRKWSPGSDVACCSAEALGFLLGWDADQVLELYWATCSDPDEGATILATLKAAREIRPRGAIFHSLEFRAVEPLDKPVFRNALLSAPQHVDHDPQAAVVQHGMAMRAGPACAPLARLGEHVSPPGHPLILGVTLPEPHAVAVTPDGTWWSWGEPFDPAGWPELIIDEAWAVSLATGR